MNIIWLITGGIWIAITHAIFGLILCITIIGIPFGLQHFKLTAIALSPFGRDIVKQMTILLLVRSLVTSSRVRLKLLVLDYA